MRSDEMATKRIGVGRVFPAFASHLPKKWWWVESPVVDGSRDGTRLAVAHRDGRMVGSWSVQPAKGEPKRVVKFPTGEIRKVTSMLESKGFLFDSKTSSEDVVLGSDFQSGRGE